MTQRILIEIGGCSLDLMVRDEADLDGTFTGICNDTGETLRVNGWLADDIIYLDEHGEEIAA